MYTHIPNQEYMHDQMCADVATMNYNEMDIVFGMCNSNWVSMERYWLLVIDKMRC